MVCPPLPDPPPYPAVHPSMPDVLVIHLHLLAVVQWMITDASSSIFYVFSLVITAAPTSVVGHGASHRVTSSINS